MRRHGSVLARPRPGALRLLGRRPPKHCRVRAERRQRRSLRPVSRTVRPPERRILPPNAADPSRRPEQRGFCDERLSQRGFGEACTGGRIPHHDDIVRPEIPRGWRVVRSFQDLTEQTRLDLAWRVTADRMACSNHLEEIASRHSGGRGNSHARVGRERSKAKGQAEGHGAAE